MDTERCNDASDRRCVPLAGVATTGGVVTVTVTALEVTEAPRLSVALAVSV